VGRGLQSNRRGFVDEIVCNFELQRGLKSVAQKTTKKLCFSLHVVVLVDFQPFQTQLSPTEVGL
jgi:hypothetical protein